jgi:hypothetical protein
MASADFCPITSGIALRGAAEQNLGSGGDSRAFALGLSPAPVALSAACRADLPG